MKALVFGSFNIDKLCFLEHLPEKGETLYCKALETHVGGKGLNQAVSLFKAGTETYVAGYIGNDGKFMLDFLNETGVNTDFVHITDTLTGSTIIEVDPDGQNQMILFGGANQEIAKEYCDKILEEFTAGDLVLMQYETAQVEYMIEQAHKKGLVIAVNPSPYVEKVKTLDYSKVDYLILNETEGQSITDKTEIDDVIEELKKLCGKAVVMTLGGDGAVYADKNKTVRVPAFKVEAVDTTGAGDTFTGYFLNAVFNGTDEKQALVTACAASAIAVKKSGAAETIPDRKYVEEFLKVYL